MTHEKSLRVLHVLGELRPSGAEVMLKVAAPHFLKNNIQIGILSTGENETGPYAGALSDCGYALHHLPFSRSAKFLGDLRKLIATQNYEIVHLHTERASFWMALATVSMARVVRTIHSNFQFTGLLRMRRIATRALSRLAGVQHIAISPSVQENEKRRFLNPSVLCCNWYDDQKFYPPNEAERSLARQKLGLSDSTFAVISIGNCAPVKNHTLLFETISQMKDRRDIRYLHVGHEDDEQSERRLSEKLGISSSVIFLSHKNDVRDALIAADCFLMPSLYEGFGNAAIEAIAVGLPAILSNTPAFLDFSEWFKGIDIVSLNAEDWANAISHMTVQSKAELRAGTSGNTDLANKLFSTASGVERYCKIYRDS